MTPLSALHLIWGLWGASWLVAGLWTARTVARSTLRGTRSTLAIVFLGFFGLFGEPPGHIASLWRTPGLLGWAMVALATAGFLFAWWARLHLGRLWSGGVVRREAHRLVDSGPYRIVRHPIYTGLIAAAAALAAVKASPLAIGGALCVGLGFALKARVEERFLAAELGAPAYAAYRARVPMLVPHPFGGKRRIEPDD